MPDSLLFPLYLAILAILIFFLSRLSLWMRIKWKDNKKKKNEISRSHNRRSYGYINQPKSRAVARHLYAISYQLQAKDDQDRGQDQKKAFRDWLTICLERRPGTPTPFGRVLQHRPQRCQHGAQLGGVAGFRGE